MFNITLFDGPSLGDCPGQAAGEGGHAGWELATAAGVPSAILALIAVLVHFIHIYKPILYITQYGRSKSEHCPNIMH